LRWKINSTLPKRYYFTSPVALIRFADKSV
jgi:hypothetical protein